MEEQHHSCHSSPQTSLCREGSPYQSPKLETRRALLSAGDGGSMQGSHPAVLSGWYAPHGHTHTSPYKNNCGTGKNCCCVLVSAVENPCRCASASVWTQVRTLQGPEEKGTNWEPSISSLPSSPRASGRLRTFTPLSAAHRCVNDSSHFGSTPSAQRSHSVHSMFAHRVLKRLFYPIDCPDTPF